MDGKIDGQKTAAYYYERKKEEPSEGILQNG